MTPEERQQKLDRLKKLKRLRELKAKRAPPEQLPEQPPEELGGMDRARGVGTALAGGATFGWGDEISSGLAATMAKISGDEKPFGEIYDDIYAHETKRQKGYEEAHPLESMGLNLAGGLTTGGMGLTKALATQPVKKMGTLGKTLTGMGVGATEGAVGGAGSAEEGERLKGAGTGAAIGTVLPAALSLGSGAVKRRISKDMVDEAGDFLPLNLATKEGSTLQNIYQKIVGPSFGGQKLRDQNRVILDKTMKAAEKAKGLQESAKTTGKKALDKTLRKQTIKASLPTGVTDDVRKSIENADGHVAIDSLNEAWKDGFKMVKDKTFTINPKEMLDDVVGELDSPVDADFVSNIKGILKKKLGQGFKPDTSQSATKYRTKGMGSEKIPDVELDTGSMSGEHLIEARNALKRQANKLGDEGSAALEKSALRKAADKIDDQIRASLDKTDAKQFDDELTAYGNYQVSRGSVKKAVQSKQGEWSIEDQLSTVGQRQGRSAETGKGFLQPEAQQLQKQGQEAIEDLTGKADLAKEAESQLKKVIPNLNPDPWTKAVSTATMSAPFLPTKAAQLLMPVGYGIGKGLSTEGVQKAIAGQTGTQMALQRGKDAIPEALRKFIKTNLQGAVSRTGTKEYLGE